MISIACNANDLDVLARTIDGEAGDQPLEAKVAVAWSVRNRLAFQHAWWGSTVAGVCQRAHQYDCWTEGTKDCARIKALDVNSDEYQHALGVGQAVMAGDIPDPTGGSTTYKNTGTPAMWDEAVEDMTPRQLGAFSFWRLSPDGHCLPFVSDLGDANNVGPAAA